MAAKQPAKSVQSIQSAKSAKGGGSFQFSVVNENLSVIGHSVSRNRLFISLKTEN